MAEPDFKWVHLFFGVCSGIISGATVLAAYNYTLSADHVQNAPVLDLAEGTITSPPTTTQRTIILPLPITNDTNGLSSSSPSSPSLPSDSSPSLSLGSSTSSSSSSALSLTTTLPLSGRNYPKNGDWIAVKGEVFIEDNNQPLESYNKDKCAVIEEVVQLQRRNLGDVYSHRRFLDRSFREAPWGLSNGSSTSSTSSSSSNSTGNILSSSANSNIIPTKNKETIERILVERGAVRRAYERTPISISGLESGGTFMEPYQTGWLPALLKILGGYVDEGRVHVHNVLPVGITATVIGRFDSRGNRVFVGVHPSLGFYVLTDGVESVVASYRSSARWSTVFASIFALLSVWQVRSYITAAYPQFRFQRWIRRQYLRWFGGEGENTPTNDDDDGNESTDTLSRSSSSSPNGSSRNNGGRQTSSSPSSPHLSVIDPLDEPAPPGEEECVICTERRRIAVLVPCGHMHTCMTCATRLRNSALPRDRRCPVCRETITQVVRVYGATRDSTHTSTASHEVNNDDGSSIPVMQNLDSTDSSTANVLPTNEETNNLPSLTTTTVTISTTTTNNGGKRKGKK